MALWDIKLARGKKANLPQLSLGEPAYVTDEGELYIGGVNGENINITNNAQLSQTVKKTDIVNNALATIEGKVLDATVGKFLNDKIDKIKFATMFVTANEFAEGTGTDTLTFVISGAETNLFSTPFHP